MSHYNDDVTSCRVDFFKPSGKWGYTEAIQMPDYNGEDYFGSIKKALREHLCGRMEGMVAVCLYPYHKHSHPVMISDWSE